MPPPSPNAVLAIGIAFLWLLMRLPNQRTEVRSQKNRVFDV
jgi:hypothetical protein